MPQEPLFPVENIQGNILPGFNKDFQTLLFLKIVDGPSFKRWLGNLLPSVTTMAQVLDFRRQLQRSARRPRATWLNLAFSHAALDVLGALQDGDFKDEAFRQGLWRRSKDLGDPTDAKSEGYQGNWRVGGEKNEAHLIIIIASDDPQDLSMAVDRIRATIYAPGSGAQITFEQAGAVLPGPFAGREHFGFRDGISQPGVRGLIVHNPPSFLTPRQNPTNKHQGKPGQDLLWPGEFVFGYPGQDAQQSVEEPGVIVDAGLAWAENGSFLVFRRLRQQVGAFHQFLHDAARPLNMDVELLGAKCVGRWPSGAPILRAPDLDNAGVAQDEMRNNNFEFFEDDRAGRICPFASHIRKVYPRDDRKDIEAHFPSAQQTLNKRISQTHRLLRRGIPYGEPSPSTLHFPSHDAVDRGLLFLAYQTSIVRQFEFVQQAFANSTNFKEKDVGYDPLVGQNKFLPTRERHFVVTFRDYDYRQNNNQERIERVRINQEWVIPTGGGYFFAPSLASLRTLVNKARLSAREV